jgi:hypothetical protein
MTETGLADLGLLPYEHLVGLVTIGASSLEHAVRYLHVLTLVDVDDETPDDATMADLLDMHTPVDRLAREARRSWRDAHAAGILSTDELSAGVAWTRRVGRLLGRRDVVVHALWKADPSIPEGLRGRHLRSGSTVPDLDGIRALADEIRSHLRDERGTAIALALLRLRGIDPPMA